MLYKYFLFILLLPLSLKSQIIIDGIYDDWSSVSTEYFDSSNDGKYGFDFGKFAIDNDSEYLYINFTTGKLVNLQNDNDFVLFIDIDSNPNTGYKINGMGADISYFFGERYGFFYRNGNRITLKHSDIGLIPLPTVSSSTFELAIKRKFKAGSYLVNISNKIKLFLFQDVTGGDKIPDENGGFAYTMNDVEFTPPKVNIYKIKEEHLRILSYNVEKDHFFFNEPPYKRLIQAVTPDILCFQEVYNHSSSEMRTKIKSYFGGNWYHAKIGSDLIIVSKYPIIKSHPIEGNAAFLVKKANKNILIINAHLYCCDKDSKRQKEVDKIMQFIRLAKDQKGSIPLKKNTPIIIMGDMNFVGSNRQKQTLIEGDISNNSKYGSDFLPDWDSSFLEDARPLTIGYPASFTWNSDYSSYPKGRLDYMIYTGSVLEKENSYVLFTRKMKPDMLDNFHLNSQDSDNASDHFPLIVDFSFKNYDATDDLLIINYELKILKSYPNPADDILNIKLESKVSSGAKVLVYNDTGQLLYSINHKLIKGINKISLDVSKLNPGFYFAKIFTQEQSTRTIAFTIQRNTK